MEESMERRARVPVVTYTLVGLNVGVYLFTTLVGEPPGPLGTRAILDWGGLYGPYVLDGQWGRIPMSMFLHLGFDHLSGNMLVLLLAGFPAERLFGSFTFAVLFVVCGIAGAMASLVVHPGLLLVGSSAGVLGIVAALLGFLLRRPAARASVRMLNVAWTTGIALLAYNAFMAALLRFGAFTNVGHAAHAAGVLVGLGLGFAIARPTLEEDEAPRRWAALPVALVGVSMLVGGLLLTPRVDDALGLILDVQKTEAEIRAESAVKSANSWYLRRNWPELEAIGRWPALGKVKPSEVLPLYRVFRTRANEMDRVDPRLEEPMRELREYLQARIAQLEDYSAI